MDERPPVWKMVREATTTIENDVMTYKEIEQYIKNKYGNDVKAITDCIICCSVNHESRIHHHPNKTPRPLNREEDFLYRIAKRSGKVTLYNPDIHGIWEIAKNDKSVVVQRVEDTISMVHSSTPDMVSPIRQIDTQQKNSRRNIPQPSFEQVKIYLDKWASLENYTVQESALNKLFWQTAPTNNSLDDILIKVATLNDFYSTHIKSIFTMARHILHLEIDKRLQASDESVVDDIANITMPNGKMRNEFSFATKYCSHHRADDYPIYDSYVEKLLCYFRDVDGFADFHKNDLREFSIFKRTILEFRKFYLLEDFSVKAIDKYLWQLGKESFPNKYYSSKSKK